MNFPLKAARKEAPPEAFQVLLEEKNENVTANVWLIDEYDDEIFIVHADSFGIGLFWYAEPTLVLKSNWSLWDKTCPLDKLSKD